MRATFVGLAEYTRATDWDAHPCADGQSWLLDYSTLNYGIYNFSFIYIYIYTNTVSDKTRAHDLWNGHANEKLSNGRLLVMIQLGSYQAHQGHMIIYSETTGLPGKPIMSWCLRVLKLRTSNSTVWNSRGCAWKWYLLRQASACWRGNYMMKN